MARKITIAELGSAGITAPDRHHSRKLFLSHSRQIADISDLPPPPGDIRLRDHMHRVVHLFSQLSTWSNSGKPGDQRRLRRKVEALVQIPDDCERSEGTFWDQVTLPVLERLGEVATFYAEILWVANLYEECD